MQSKKLIIAITIALAAVAALTQLRPNAQITQTSEVIQNEIARNDAPASREDRIHQNLESNRQSCMKRIASGGKKPEEFCTCKMNLEINLTKLKDDHMRGVFGAAFFDRLSQARITNPSQEEMRQWFLEEEKFQPTVDAVTKTEKDKCLALYVPDEEGALKQLYTETYNSCMDPNDLAFATFIQPSMGTKGERTQKFCQCYAQQQAKSQYVGLVSDAGYQGNVEAIHRQSIEDLYKNPQCDQ